MANCIKMFALLASVLVIVTAHTYMEAVPLDVEEMRDQSDEELLSRVKKTAEKGCKYPDKACSKAGFSYGCHEITKKCKGSDCKEVVS